MAYACRGVEKKLRMACPSGSAALMSLVCAERRKDQLARFAAHRDLPQQQFLSVARLGQRGELVRLSVRSRRIFGHQRRLFQLGVQLLGCLMQLFEVGIPAEQILPL